MGGRYAGLMSSAYVSYFTLRPSPLVAWATAVHTHTRRHSGDAVCLRYRSGFYFPSQNPARDIWRQEADMAQEPDRLAFRLGVVVGVALIVLAIMTWAGRGWHLHRTNSQNSQGRETCRCSKPRR
jgi:hypothetical protein